MVNATGNGSPCMHAKRFALLLVAFLVLLAGCGAGGGTGSTPTATPTDAQNTGTSTATPTETGPSETTDPTQNGDTETGDVVPGVSTERVNTTALFAAHRQTLNGTALVRQTIEVRDDGPGPDQQTVSVVVDSESRSFKVTNETSTAERTWWWNVDEGAIALRSHNQSGTDLRYGKNDPSLTFGAALVIGSYYRAPGSLLQQGQFEYAGNVTRNGETLIELRATGLAETGSGSGSNSGASFGSEDETATDLSGTVLVRPTGVVHSMNLSVAYQEGGATHMRTYSFGIELDGSGSVTPPSWLSKLPDATGSFTDDGKVYTVDYATGPTIPAGTILTVKQGYSAMGTVSIPESVEEGETIYVYATGQPNANVTVHVSIGSEPDLPADAMRLQGNRIALAGTIGDVRFSIGPDQTATED